MPPFDGDSDSDGSEDAFDLQDVSSDVEMDPNELDDDARLVHPGVRVCKY
jgi:FK506-binding nuclear protein